MSIYYEFIIWKHLSIWYCKYFFLKEVLVSNYMQELINIYIFSEQITKIKSLKMEDCSNNANSDSLHECNIFILFSYGMQIR